MVTEPSRLPAFRSSLRPVLLTIGGLIIVEAVVASAVYSGLQLYALLLLLALGVGYLVVRYPPGVAYLTMGWLVFEKGIGGNLGSLSATVSTAGDGLLVLALFETLLVNLIRRRGYSLTSLMRFGPVGPGLVAFVALGVVSTLINDVSLRVALLGITSTVHTVIILLIILNVGITAGDVRRFVFVALAVMSVAGLIGVLQIPAHSPAWILGGERLYGSGGLIRVDGPFDHPNSNSDYLAMVIPLACALLFFGGLARRGRVLLAGGTGLMLISLLFTFSREAWLALPVAMIVLGLTVERRLLKYFLFFVVPAGGALLLLYAPLAHRLSETANGNLRFTLLKLSWPLIRSHFLLGVGPGRFGGHVALVTHTPLYAQYHLLDFFYGTGNQIDMFWTHLVAESGILGTAAYLMMLVSCYLVGRRAYTVETNPQRRAILLGLLAVVPVAIFVSLVSATLEAAPGATLFWGLMGMMLVLSFDTLSGQSAQNERPAYDRMIAAKP